MAVRINPCFRCPARHGCEKREELRQRVQGLGLVSARFRCDRLQAELRLGRRIVIKHPFMSGNPDDYDQHLVWEEVLATIWMVDSAYRIAVVVDAESGAEDKFRFRKYMSHMRIVRFADEPDREMCKSGRIKRGDACDRRPDDICMCEEAMRATA